MPSLPDPRCYAAAHTNPLLLHAERSIATADATQRMPLTKRLEKDLRERLARGDDETIKGALLDVSSAAAGRVLWRAIDAALGTPDCDSALAAAVFALPVVFVAGHAHAPSVSPGKTSRIAIPGSLADTTKLVRLLEEAGALGSTRNFGIGAALCAADVLLRTSLRALFLQLRAIETGASPRAPDLPPAPIVLDAPGERVELRFIAGLAVTGAQAASLPSAAGDVGRWGMPFTRELIQQLGQPRLSLLPIPRPPLGWFVAHHAGTRARENIALQAFLSRTLREFRAVEGDPSATVTALQPAAVGIKLASRLGSGRSFVHSVSLHPLDDMDEVTTEIFGLLRECRLEDVRVMREVSTEAELARN
ncbi:MAG: hypothetical protein C5B46_07020 [Proteobacteria bacterium]|nr:MAG: hypothetical protein C5B46_07020 [Pseudomonadota bacterium]